MGGCGSKLPLNREDLERMLSETFLKKSEILKLYAFWEKMGASYYEEPKIILSNVLISNVKALEVHPWAKRICFTFASQRDPLSGLCALNFDDLLRMASAFCFRSPMEIKQYVLQLCVHRVRVQINVAFVAL